MVDKARHSAGKVDVVFLFSDKDGGADRFLVSNGIENRNVRRVNFSDLGLTRIPLLAIAERDGAISRMWTGTIPEDKQSTVLKAITE